MLTDPHPSAAVWRVLTAAVFHMGVLHLAFNMLAFVPIGQSLERLVGTVQVLPQNLAQTPSPWTKHAKCLRVVLAVPGLHSVSLSPESLIGTVHLLPDYVCCEGSPERDSLAVSLPPWFIRPHRQHRLHTTHSQVLKRR
jgi:hypothetical protein